ncbi:MAG: hypothetical protein AVDCRST_MAG72-1067 [uncultured Nocardioidaceae bacterium]|uniref:2-C-methyl-D-erythritol 4-phosphate cytidylyltransferase n=1 Tax=uncultured Nocardioidaceae bacterium TaxID=253824 RepID=A0A6J4LY34_9ACTN|nr:MAG: hypothetical protein AVDCRST_MAG72-1067 [uncultured Nocardioidaceae bacterium]
MSWAGAALARSGATTLEPNRAWTEVADLDACLVLHDALCPLTPAAFIADLVERAAESGAVVVGVQPVTDTIKAVDDGQVVETMDRLALWEVVSPLVLPAPVVRSCEDWPATRSLARMFADLATAFAVRMVEAPAAARRVDDESALRLHEAYAQVSGPL